MRTLVLLLVANAVLCASSAYSQDDAPSLGDVARQSRQQKQQKDAQPKGPSDKSAARDPKNVSPKPAHIITGEELPEHTAVKTAISRGPDDLKVADDGASSGNRGEQGEHWKQQIQEQKQSIAALQHEIDGVGESIHYAGRNCIANCVQWNERQKQKQDQVESMKAQLAEQQAHLEEMQEAARKQGFGSSIYEP
jgi:hypothetical protein